MCILIARGAEKRFCLDFSLIEGGSNPAPRHFIVILAAANFQQLTKVFIHTTLLNHINAVIIIVDDDRKGINFSLFCYCRVFFFDPLLLIDVSKSSQRHDFLNQGHIFLAVGSALKKVIQQQLVQEHVTLQKSPYSEDFLRLDGCSTRKKGACYQILPTLILERNDTLLFQTYLTADEALKEAVILVDG